MTLRKKPAFSLIDSRDGDWHGLYVDGELVMEGHSLRTDDVLEYLNTKGLIYYEGFDLKEGFEGNLPKKLEELEASGDIDA